MVKVHEWTSPCPSSATCVSIKEAKGREREREKEEEVGVVSFRWRFCMYFREDCFVLLLCLGFLFCFVSFFSSPWKERKNQRTCETESERRPCVGFMSTICRLLRFVFSSASKIVAWHVKVGALALPSSITREALENCKSATA